MIIYKCHIGRFSTVLGEIVILLPLCKHELFPCKIFSIFAESLDAAIIPHQYFNHFFFYNQMISYLLITFLTTIIWRWFELYIHNDHRKGFIFPISTHIQIVANAHAILHSYHVSLLYKKKIILQTQPIGFSSITITQKQTFGVLCIEFTLLLSCTQYIQIYAWMQCKASSRSSFLMRNGIQYLCYTSASCVNHIGTTFAQNDFMKVWSM